MISRKEMASIRIKIEEWRGSPVYDPDDPKYLESGDPDDMPIVGLSDFYRVILSDDQAQKRKVLEAKIGADREQMLRRITLEIQEYLKTILPEA